MNNREETFLYIDGNDDETNESISSATTSSGYDTSTSTSTSSNDSYSTIDTFIDHDIDWIRSSLDEYEENGEFWDYFRRLLFFNIMIPFIFIILMILLKKFFDFDY